jgi:hypothetical protein
MDGLKISLRKILYSGFKKNLTTEIKVAQFSGYVSEHSGYHHGEASLNAAIVGMAQNFVGSNNINLLEPNGQFGTRLQGGDDSASERYIFTQLNPITRHIFPEADDAVLKYINDDGTIVEPEFYSPIIPFALINGISGIGTGFSCNIAAQSKWREHICVAALPKDLPRESRSTDRLIPSHSSPAQHLERMLRLVATRTTCFLQLSSLETTRWRDRANQLLSSPRNDLSASHNSKRAHHRD